MRRLIFFLIACICVASGRSEDTIPTPYRFKATDLIAPAALVAVGVAGLELKPLKRLNREVTDGLWHPGQRDLKFDNFTPYLPIAATYGLNLCGYRGEHSLADFTIITVTAHLLMCATVYPVKDFVRSGRPDGSGFNSFPSGHTAWAFTGAEIMRREYWGKSPWLAMSGYVVAAGTAFMRLYNGAHWLTDVLAGAGIGILAAEAAYWLYPAITKHLFPSRWNRRVMLSPAAGPRGASLNAYIEF